VIGSRTATSPTGGFSYKSIFIFVIIIIIIMFTFIADWIQLQDVRTGAGDRRHVQRNAKLREFLVDVGESESVAQSRRSVDYGRPME